MAIHIKTILYRAVLIMTSTSDSFYKTTTWVFWNKKN